MTINHRKDCIHWKVCFKGTSECTSKCIDFISAKSLIIAFSAGYEIGHNDTADGHFQGNGTHEYHDQYAYEWVVNAFKDNVFQRDIELGKS